MNRGQGGGISTILSPAEAAFACGFSQAENGGFSSHYHLLGTSPPRPSPPRHQGILACIFGMAENLLFSAMASLGLEMGGSLTPHPLDMTELCSSMSGGWGRKIPHLSSGESVALPGLRMGNSHSPTPTVRTGVRREVGEESPPFLASEKSHASTTSTGLRIGDIPSPHCLDITELCALCAPFSATLRLHGSENSALVAFKSFRLSLFWLNLGTGWGWGAVLGQIHR